MLKELNFRVSLKIIVGHYPKLILSLLFNASHVGLVPNLLYVSVLNIYLQLKSFSI